MSDARSSRVAAIDGFDTIRQQESVLILLNLGIIASLMIIHVLFQSRLGRPSLLIIGLFLGRFAWQVLELLWLHALPQSLSLRATRAYATGTVCVHLAFGAIMPLLAEFEHSHYVVLMILPTIAAAFRFGWLGTLAVVSVAGFATMFEVHVHFAGAPSHELIAEYFEAATAVLGYFVVGLVVRLLVQQLRLKELRLRSSLDDLALTRNRLIAEEKLAAVGRLSAAVAHEIGNPVAIIAGAAAAARRAEGVPADHAEMHRVIEVESARLSRLTDSFLNYARQKAPERVPTSVRVTLEYVAGLARPRATALHTDVAIDCALDLSAAFDPFQVHQALLNLVLNALEAAGENGRVSIAARTDRAGGCVFCVRNTGAAIGPDALGRIFEPFYTTRPQGTGLGLAIAQKIAEAHGGSLALTRNLPDEIEFELRLPAAPSADGHY